MHAMHKPKSKDGNVASQPKSMAKSHLFVLSCFDTGKNQRNSMLKRPFLLFPFHSLSGKGAEGRSFSANKQLHAIVKIACKKLKAICFFSKKWIYFV